MCSHEYNGVKMNNNTAILSEITSCYTLADWNICTVSWKAVLSSLKYCSWKLFV